MYASPITPFLLKKDQIYHIVQYNNSSYEKYTIFDGKYAGSYSNGNVFTAIFNVVQLYTNELYSNGTFKGYDVGINYVPTRMNSVDSWIDIQSICVVVE